MSDHIAISCPNCSQTLNVRSEYLGRRATCKHCQVVITLKQPQEVKAQAGKVESIHGTGTALWEPKPSADLEQDLRAEVDRLKRYLTSISEERDTLRSDFEQTRAELTDARATVERLEGVEAELSKSHDNLAEATAKAELLAAELEAANRRYEGLRDDLQAEHATKHQDALNLAETHRLEAESWKSRHDEKAREHGDVTLLLEEERSRSRTDLDRLTGEHEALKSQLNLTESRQRDEAERLQTRLGDLENERDVLVSNLAEWPQRFEQESQSRQTAEAAAEDLRGSLAAAEEKARELESGKLRALQESTEALETRVNQLAGELEVRKARGAELEAEIAKRIEDAQRDQQLLSQAKEFKEQIRTFLSGLGINLPES